MAIASSPTLFFDRSVGKRIPEVLRRLQVPIGIEFHQQHFPADEMDDVWLPVVGQRGWTVIGQDWSYHKNLAEISAIRQYDIGVFYLWASQARTWEQFFCLVKAYDRILQVMMQAPRPFIYRIGKSGRLQQETIPSA